MFSGGSDISISLVVFVGGAQLRRYLREQRFGSLQDQSQFNFGLDWSPHPAVSATISYQHGDYWGLTLDQSAILKLQHQGNTSH